MEAISVVWVAVSVCKAVVFGSFVSNLVSNEAISVLWVAVSDCKEVISVSLDDIWVIWLEVSSSNSVEVVCNPSIKSCLLSIKVAIFPMGSVKLVWISTLPFIKRLLLIVPPVFCK